MYESMTYEYLLDKLLKNALNVNPNLDTREGSIIYNAVAPIAVELTNAYIALDNILNETFADTATRENLIKRAKERGIVVQSATKAIRRGSFDTTKDIPIGSRFSLNLLNYKVIKQESSSDYQLECETPGIVGNMEVGKLTPIDYVEGLKSAELLSDILIAGDEEEDTEVLRERYFNSLNAKAFGGNINDYKEKVNLIEGVGGVKVYPAFFGGGTVRLVIIGTDFNSASETLVDRVQTEIDPIQNQGQGYGIAPIGHSVTVESVKQTPITIKSEIKFKDDWTLEDAQIYLDECIENYFKELSKDWEKSENIELKISYIESRLLDLPCVDDIQNTTLNDIPKNFIIDSDSIPIMEGISSV